MAAGATKDGGWPFAAATGPAGEGGERLFAEQVALTYQQVPAALVGGVLNGLVLIYVLWNVSPRPYLLIWAGLGLVFAVTRSLLTRKFRHTPPAARNVGRWYKVVVGTTVLSGLHMGLGAAAVFPSQSVVHQVFIAFITGGLVAGSVTTYCAFKWLGALYFVPSVLPVTVRFFAQDNEISIVMGGLTLLFSVLMLFISRNMHRTALSSLQLRLTNEVLVENLSRTNQQTEKLNQELTVEIEERIQAETALRESEEKFRGLVENATDGIVLANPTRILYANQAAIDMSGFSEEELYQQPVSRFLSDDPAERGRLEERAEALFGGQPFARQVEAQLKTGDGKLVPVIISSSAIMGGVEPRAISIIKDITNRKEKENELRVAKERAEEATMIKDRFVNLVAHDLRSPLTSISGILDFLYHDAPQPMPEQQKSLLELVMQSAQTLHDTIEDLLGHDRLQSGTLRAVRRFAPAREMVQAAINLLGYLAGKKNVEIRNEIPADFTLFADPQLIRKVFQNLLSNAIKFSRPGGEITFFVSPGRAATVAVRDTGVGIPAERIPFLFDPESGSPTSGTAGEQGTGQGLSFCREILTAHGGEITLESGENLGSTFFVTFPPDAPTVVLYGEHPLFEEMPNYHWGEVAVDFVRFSEHPAAPAGAPPNGAHLIVAAHQGNGKEPNETLKILRNQAGLKGVPIILILPEAELESVDRAFQGGVDDILINPTAAQQLAEKMLRFLR